MGGGSVWSLHSPWTRATLCVAVVGALAAPAVWRQVERSATVGTGTGGPEDYAWGLGWALVLGALIAFAPVRKGDRPVLVLLWSLKIVTGLGLMLFYETRYNDSLDTYGYYLRPVTPGYDVPTPAFGGVDNVYGLVWILHWIVPDSFHAVKMTFALIGLAGIYLAYRAAQAVWPRTPPALLVLLGAYPSLLFWSTILGKDPLVILGLGLAMLGFAWMSVKHRHGALLAAAGVLVVLMVRPWIAPMAVVPAALVAATLRWGGPTAASRARWFATAFFGPLTLLAAIALLAGETPAMTALLARLNALTRAWAFGGSGQVPPQFTSVWSVLVFFPLGAFTALFRPLPGEVPSAFGLMAGLDGLTLLTLVAAAAVRLARRPAVRGLVDAAVLWGLAFTVCWTLLYAFLSYQNLGTAFRFRAQLLPVLLLVLWRLALARPASAWPVPRGRPRRILHVTTVGGPLAGAERMLVTLAGDVDRREWELHLATLGPEGPLHEEFRARGWTASSLGSPSTACSPMALWRLARLVRRWQPDVLHVHLARPSVLAAVIKPFVGAPVVQTRHYGDFLQRAAPRWEAALDAWAARRMDLVLAVSSASAHDLRSIEGVPADRVRVAANGIDLAEPGLDAESQADAGIAGPYLACAATWHPRKGHAVLFAALAQLAPRHPGLRLVLLGAGTQDPRVAAAASQAGIGDRVEALGFCDRTRALAVVRRATAYVQPSLEEGFGVAVVEAMALRVPVVVSDVGGMAETVEQGVTGLRTPPGDADALAKAIAALLADPEARRAMGAAGRRRVERMYSGSAMRRAYEACYEELAQRAAARPVAAGDAAVST